MHLNFCVLDPPSKPGKPEVKDSDKKQVTIGWDKPKKDGGAPIKGYNVERKDPRTGRWVKLNKVPVQVSHCKVILNQFITYVAVKVLFLDIHGYQCCVHIPPSCSLIVTCNLFSMPMKLVFLGHRIQR